ncbi:SNF2 family N-terminal domain-containing protein [Panaeolus papilionaceus]|nr:SNF2 family N-terminal domain-containing protein [Panaeolus papilionaceus]
MPMEHIRRRFAEDANLYPELNGSKTQGGPAQPISIASTSKNSSTSSGPSAPPRKPTQKAARLVKRATVILSSDEEGDRPQTVSDSDDSDDSIQIIERPAGNNNHKSPIHARVKNIFETTPAPSSKPPSKTSIQPIPFNPAPARIPIILAPSKFAETPAMQRPNPNPSGGTPITIPFNHTPTLPPPAQKVRPEPVHNLGPPIPGFRNVEEDRYVPPAQVEKELRDLMSGGMNTDLENHVEIDMSQSKVEGFTEGIELLPHQILGRAWMKDREDVTKKAHGGILADDMGLGKTIQTLTRMVEGRARKSDRDDGWSAATLVICPLALVGQWADEIQKMTKLKVIKHQGPSRTKDPRVWSNYHVVVTTYDTVRNEYESFAPSAKDESKASTTKAKKNDDDDDSDSEAENFGRTLAKKPVKKGNKRDALFHVKWFRIVLDEAHNIKNHKTKGAIACCELEAKFRWALTGTPMQNNVTELFSLLKFLRTKPLSQWDTFNEQIAKPVNSGRGAVRAMKRLQVVLQKIMLRRRKDQSLNGKALIQLPKRTIEIISCPFDPSERNFYTALETKMEDVIEKLMATTNKNYMSMLLLLLRLRQACNHPILVAKDYKQDTDAVEPRAVTKGKDDLDADADDLIAAFGQLGVTKKCQLCMTVLSSSNTAEAPWQTHCMDCASLAEEAKKSESDRPSSAKIRMVLKLLKDIDDRSQCEEKTIIFSQFTSMLDLIEPFLQDKGIKYVRYDGSMLPKEREAALDKIKTSNSTRVILISFKAGSTGLNLTACNNVILVDLWWNPALEDQAFDRAHRFGQKRDVNIFKLKIDNTVEDRILDLQDKKRILAAAALSGDRIKDMRLGMEDLLALFRPGGRDDDDEDSD